ncbi:MAG: PEP-CTERM sorting domain-containing protein, partial [Phycisphaerales bacterium]
IEQIADPFYQEAGTIYWLDLSVITLDPLARVGWKTSLDHFEDDAVWSVAGLGWQELFDPFNGQSLDLAFVITPEPATAVLLGVGTVLACRRRRWHRPPAGACDPDAG